MKKFFSKVTLCLALSIIFSSTLSASASILTGEVASAVNNNEYYGNTYINNEEVVEVFNNGKQQLYITQSDIDLMAKLVYGESRGEPFEGKVGVASVVLNRTLNPSFPNTIKDVIFQPKAFSCVKNNDIVANPDKSCYQAVFEAIKGKDPTNKALYFYNPALTTCSWMKSTEKMDTKSIGHHVFFKC